MKAPYPTTSLTRSIDGISRRLPTQTQVAKAGMRFSLVGFRITLVLGVLLLFIALIPKSNAYSEKRPAKLSDWYYAAQDEFVKDMKSGKIELKATDANKCDTVNPDTGKPFSIAALVFAFDYNESKNGTEGQSVKTNNWSSLHPNGSYYYMWN